MLQYCSTHIHLNKQQDNTLQANCKLHINILHKFGQGEKKLADIDETQTILS